ncbi:uncharacterized protein [Dysidea avara]|uniref:uncharacterized protein n=1 Tax=Dysidea avara TaxID=196820 RepID=UPI0033192B82
MAVSYEINYKDILRDVYDSEELKIDSQRSKSIAKVIDQLCVSENTAFSDLFSLVSKEVEQKRKEPAAIRNSFQACYMYQAERLPVVLQQLGKEQQGSMNDSLLWQMIIERLFMGGNVEQSVEELSGDQREFSVIEENAIYHAAGYVIRKLIKKFRRNGGENAYMDTAILLHMIDEGTVGDVPDSTDSFLDYVKVWTNNIDRGGLSHASNDAYRFFVALETAFTTF